MENENYIDAFYDKKFYAYIEQIEENQESFELILDGIERKVFDEINENNVFEILEKVDTNIFSLILKKHIYKELQDSNWISFSLTNKETEYPINLYDTVFFDEAPEQLFIENIKPIRINGKQKIYSMEIFEEATENAIFNILNTISENKIHNVVVYNVGQGNCNSLTDSSGIPNLYYDFGGGVFQNTKTYPGELLNPNKIKFCYTTNPPVVLSHWDWDHMSSIMKIDNQEIKESNWIVPKQEIGITHLKIAVELYNNHKLIVWPDNLSLVNTNNIELQKLTVIDKKDKNNNGLVLTVDLSHICSGCILLPADANYELINQKESYTGLVATHHGASSHNCLNKIPNSMSEAMKIAYSFGYKNSYNHPKMESISKHCLSGWSNVYFTTNGHIGMIKKINKLPCNGICTLSNTQ
ncbi:hypothetical protein [Aliarcobacter butzleri]|uniref:hypothetical protein n=1 Tax=Aliarcobacter butzleri TaxID=28197 RepID=UPI00263F6278|nr:hypothetical protein [Aliarcobacter butzleri]MDN5069026.1 hypothetical protein [Aliarcobacter butzleri]